MQIRKFGRVPFQLIAIKPQLEAERLKDQLLKDGRNDVRVVRLRPSDAPDALPGYFCVWAADKKLAPKAAGKKG